MELYPGFALYRGLYELGQYSFNASFLGTKGMQWGNLNDQGNGIKEIFIIMAVEWFVFLVAAYYIDQVKSPGTGIRRSSFFFLDIFRRKSSYSSSRNISNVVNQEPEVSVEGEKADVKQEVSFPYIFHINLVSVITYLSFFLTLLVFVAERKG